MKIVTKFWICGKVKDWLLDDKNLGAKELQRRIKDKYKVEVNYTRVYQGKELALKQLYGDCLIGTRVLTTCIDLRSK